MNALPQQQSLLVRTSLDALLEMPPALRLADPNYRIVVYGSPAPQGSKKFLGTYTGKDGRAHGIMGESSKKLKPWREDVKAAALLVRNGSPPLDGPLKVRMVFTLPKPASSPKTRRTYPMRMPDVSKLARSTEDALTDAGIWADDARIVEYSRLAKVYPGEDPDALESTGALIEIACI
jgi:crossover junction endodeoxyribonuclease RusA